MHFARRWSVLVAMVCCLVAGPCLAQQVEVLWLGHATFRLTSTTGKVIVIDPFLKTNPRTPPNTRTSRRSARWT